MRYEYTVNNGSSRLILIFSGWGTDPSFYSRVSVPGYDTLVVYDYSTLDFPKDILTPYHTVILFAWSLGVYAASATVPFDKVSLAIAVNGTERPVDKHLGIPEKIYDGTLTTLNEQNLLKFRRRMASKAYDGIKDSFPQPDIPHLKEELEHIRQHSRNHSIPGKWNRVYVSSEDAIFPSENQMKFWERQPSSPEIVKVPAPHYIDLSVMVRGMVPSLDIVGRRFQKAMQTYDREAVAQQEIAYRLNNLIPDKKCDRVIEIGAGTGIFTRHFVCNLQPESIDFVDLYPLPRFRLAPIENYHIADAEDWIEEEATRNPDSYDAVVSASAMQWFVNPQRFIRNAFRVLRPGGLFACSSFLPGNLGQLSVVNPYGIVYRSKEELEAYLKPYSDDVDVKEDSRLVIFDSPRHLLAHIRETGVGGSSTPSSLRDTLSRLPSSLIYLPVYLVATKKV